MGLGDSVTSDQWNQISAGTFDNLFVGDYWVINDVTYRIAGFDYWRSEYDSALNKHHVVIVPDKNIVVGCAMHGTAYASGAYLGSDFYTGTNNTARATAQSVVTSAFGSSHIFVYDEYLSNNISNGAESNAALTSISIEPMSETMVFGTNILHHYVNTSNTNVCKTRSKSQLPLFRLRPDLIPSAPGISSGYWLRDIAGNTYFAAVDKYGSASLGQSNLTIYGVRPAFAICN